MAVGRSSTRTAARVMIRARGATTATACARNASVRRAPGVALDNSRPPSESGEDQRRHPGDRCTDGWDSSRKRGSTWIDSTHGLAFPRSSMARTATTMVRSVATDRDT